MVSPSRDVNEEPSPQPQNPGLSTLSVHAGESRQKPANSLTDPIVCASTYSFENSQAIIDYIEQLKEIDTEDVPPCNHVLENMVNITREDDVGETMPRETFLSNAPSQVSGFMRVTTVIKHESK